MDKVISYYNTKMFTDPVKNLRAFGLREDSIVADLGAGTGFYSVVAGYLAPRGKVYAVDIVKDFLATIKHKAREARLRNVEIIWGDIEKSGGTKIGAGVADAVIASNVLHQLKNKEQLVHEIKRILKPRGRVLLVDWSPGILSAARVVPKHQAREMFEKGGFVWQKDINAGNYHYGMILMKINE